VILFPNCKINLGLHILRKREDGFHHLETCFYPIALQDALEIIQTDGKDDVVFTSSGVTINVATEENICVKAYRLLKKDFDLPSIKMHLHKVIPTGAGLGGGSADGAFTLLLLNKKFNLNLPEQQLIDHALQLGSVCPFFIKNKPCIGHGRGEILKEVNLNLSKYFFVLVNPQIHVNTGWAFSQIKPTDNRKSIQEIISLSTEEWRENLVNDFEEPIFKQHPEIASIKTELYNKGAIYASMSGSGATVYGLFEKDKQVQFNFPAHYFIKQI
jgi:4-diphosphocytidyl-2-C-methyl-D-erythritol kinase